MCRRRGRVNQVKINTATPEAAFTPASIMSFLARRPFDRSDSKETMAAAKLPDGISAKRARGRPARTTASARLPGAGGASPFRRSRPTDGTAARSAKARTCGGCALFFRLNEFFEPAAIFLRQSRGERGAVGTRQGGRQFGR